MYASKKLIVFCVLQLTFTRLTRPLSKSDFYDFTNATAFEKHTLKLKSPVDYPYWSDLTNKKIDITSSGVARFGGFGGSNTLDVLIYATKTPTEFKSVFYEQVSEPQDNDKLKGNLKRDIKNTNFTAKHVTILTWFKTQYLAKKESSFQMVFASDGNVTYAILQVAKIRHNNFLPYFPEFDLRFSYESGTKFKRLGFLKESTKTATQTAGTGDAAAENSNVGKAGRWVFKVTENPLPPVVNVTKAPTPGIPDGQKVTDDTGVGFQGQFSFTDLSLDGLSLTSENSNDEINIILTKKEADPRYAELQKRIKAMIAKLYKQSSNSTEVGCEILGFKIGSLIVQYAVNAKGGNICNGTTGQACLNNVKNKVTEKIGESLLKEAGLVGKIDTKKIIVEDFDECSTGKSCDFHANCVDYPNRLSFGCSCKIGYIGNGFPGNCTREFAPVYYQSIVVYVTIIVGILSLIFVIIVFCKIYKAEKLKEKEAMEESIKLQSERMRPEWFAGSSYRHNPMYGGYNFDMYQRRHPADYT